MLKPVLLAFLLALFSCAFAQEEEFGGPVSQAYDAYRRQIVEPPYSLTVVKRAIRKLKSHDDDGLIMPPAQFNRMTFAQKFTFTMIHGEIFSQNCDGMPVYVNEEKKVFSYFPTPFGQMVWSEKQLAFMRKNRTRVIGMIRTVMNSRHRVGINFKGAIVELHAKELIPDMISIYRRDRKDHDILTVLMLLMNDAGYRPFTASPLFTKLYGDKASYQSFVMATRATQDEIIARGMAFYRSK